jgi:hypothetical protein
MKSYAIIGYTAYDFIKYNKVSKNDAFQFQGEELRRLSPGIETLPLKYN